MSAERLHAIQNAMMHVRALTIPQEPRDRYFDVMDDVASYHEDVAMGIKTTVNDAEFAHTLAEYLVMAGIDAEHVNIVAYKTNQHRDDDKVQANYIQVEAYHTDALPIIMSNRHMYPAFHDGSDRRIKVAVWCMDNPGWRDATTMKLIS